MITKEATYKKAFENIRESLKDKEREREILLASAYNSNPRLTDIDRELSFIGANIAIAEGGTVEPISLAISLDGEPLAATTMTITPAAVGNYFNVSSSVFIDIPQGCCSHIAVKNISGQAIDVQNANLIAVRAA